MSLFNDESQIQIIPALSYLDPHEQISINLNY